MATIPVAISPVQAGSRCVNVDLPDGGSAARHAAELVVGRPDCAARLLVDVLSVIRRIAARGLAGQKSLAFTKEKRQFESESNELKWDRSWDSLHCSSPGHRRNTTQERTHAPPGKEASQFANS